MSEEWKKKALVMPSDASIMDFYAKGREDQQKEDIMEIVKDLEHIYRYFTKLTVSNLIDKWMEKI